MRKVREFNGTSEAEGSPVECKHAGYTPHVLLREGGERFGVVRFPDGRQRSMQWTEGGRAHWHNNDIDLVMSPIDWVEGQPVFQGDVVYVGRRRVAVNASQMGAAPPWAGATLAPVDPQRRGYIGQETLAETMTRGGLMNSSIAARPDYKQAQAVRTAMSRYAMTSLSGNPELTSFPPAGCAARLHAAIDQVQAAAPRIMLEQVAAHMQQAAVRAILDAEAMGWTGRDIAAGIVRRLDINEAVEKVLNPGAQEVKS